MSTFAARSSKSLSVLAVAGVVAVVMGALLLAASSARAAETPSHALLYSLTGATPVLNEEPPPWHNYSPDGSFEGACGVAVDSAGDIYLADYYHDAVDVYDSTGYFMTQIKAEDPGNGPCGLAVDAGGDVYVNNWHRNVVRFEPSSFPPGLSTTYGAATVIDPHPSTGIALDPATGDLYVDERTSIAAYEPSGHPVEAGGHPLQIGLDPHAEDYGVAVSAFPATKGDVYVPDAADNTVKAYDPKVSLTTPVNVIDGAGTPQAGFDSLLDSSVAVDPTDGHLYVADDLLAPFEHPAAAIDEFNSSGDYRAQLPHALTDAEPLGLAVDGTGNLYVTSGNTEEAVLYAFGPTAPAHLLEVQKTGAGVGTLASVPAGIDCGDACAAEYGEGESVILSAIPNAHSTFVGFSGGCSSEPSPVQCKVTMSAARSVSAEFAAIPQQTLGVTVTGSGEGTVASSPPGIACGAGSGTCSEGFNEGAAVTLTATPAPHNRLLAWSGCEAEPSPTQCEVTMSAARSVSAEFAAIPQQTLQVSLTGSGEGTVKSQPAGIACGSGACSAGFNEGATVTLTATPAPHNRLLAWSGCQAEPSPTQCEVTLSAARSVGASFTPITHRLAVSVTGAGSVSASSGAISGCSTAAGVCAGAYLEGSVLTLTATPAPNQAFAGFSGGGCSGTAPCQVSVAEDTEVSAAFRPIHRTLAVAASGAGFGTVTSAPAGIDCGLACAEIYDQGAVLTLTAVPALGSAFAGWSGCDSAVAQRCTVALGADRTVVPTFNPESGLSLGAATVKGASAALQVSAPGAGLLTATGKGLKQAATTPEGAGTLTLRLVLSGAGKRALARARRHRLGVAVTVTFTPSGGAPVRATRIVTFEAKRGGR